MSRRPDKKALHELYLEAKRFYSDALWESFDNEDIFAVNVPEEPDPLVVSIMGAAGQEFGLFIFRGPRALEHMNDLVDGGFPGEDDAEDWDLISCSFERLRDVPPEYRGWLKRANVRVKSSAIIPLIAAKQPGKRPRELEGVEVDIMRRLFLGIRFAVIRGALTPKAVRLAEDLLALDVSGPLEQMLVSVGGEAHSTSMPEVPPQLFVDRSALLKLPRLKRVWVVGCPVTPVAIEETDDIVRTLIVVEKGTGMVVDAQPVTGPMWRYAAMNRVFEVMQGKGVLGLRGKPKQVLVTSKGLSGPLCDELRALRVPCRYEASAEGAIRTVFESLVESLDERDRLAQGEEELEDELLHWKAVDRQVVELGRAEVSELVDGSTRLGTYYYGGAKERELVENSELDEAAALCLRDWAWLDYRPVKTKRTIAEELLAKSEIDAEARELLESLAASTTSLYRVMEVRPGRSLTLEDVLLGGKVEVTDIALSRSAEVGFCFTARVYDAGPYHFLTNLGVLLPEHMSSQALGYLESQGLKTTPKALRKSAHLFGRLWEWVLTAPRVPSLATSEGDPLELHEATLRVPEPEAFQRVLDAREDLEPTGDKGWYHWLGGQSKVNEGPVIQARLRLLGDIIEVETNSASRWERLRRWLEGIEGAELLELERTSPEDLLDSPRRGRPSRNRLEDLSEEDRSQLQTEMETMLESLAERWVDESIPALGGSTPREAVRTKAGRRMVQQLLRTMPRTAPNLSGFAGPSPNAIRRLLGLPEEDE